MSGNIVHDVVLFVNLTIINIDNYRLVENIYTASNVSFFNYYYCFCATCKL